MSEIPSEIRELLSDADPETLQATIDFAEARLAEAPSESEAESATETGEPPEEFAGDAEEWAAVTDDSDAPRRATLTTKEINDNQYLYWQWSEDGKTKSEYIAPKNPN